jgi:hypothetical protein
MSINFGKTNLLNHGQSRAKNKGRTILGSHGPSVQVFSFQLWRKYTRRAASRISGHSLAFQ